MANEEEQEVEGASSPDEWDPITEDLSEMKRILKRKRLLIEAKKANKRGVCYLSRIPPHMDPSIVRQILSQFAEVERIYLAPEDPTVHVINSKRAGRFRGQGFSEGWVEFRKKSAAKSVAKMLNGEQIGGRKRSTFYYDIWNIKYLSKFKWDDLTAEQAEKNATQVQKLAMETSAAKKEGKFYKQNLNTSIALKHIKERMKKKQKTEQDSGEVPDDSEKVVRQFHQTNPIADGPSNKKNQLPKSFLQDIFCGSSA